MQHTCEPAAELAHERLMALLDAGIRDDRNEIQDVIIELEGCVECLRRTLIVAATYAAMTMREHVPNALLAIQFQRAAAQAARTRAGG